MTKIAIISQAEQGVLVDIAGCDTLQEATQHLSSTFQVTNEFWENQPVDLNLGTMRLTKDDLAQVLAILSERGVKPRKFFAEEEDTRAALREHNIEAARQGESESPAVIAVTGLGSWAEAAAAAQGTTGDTAVLAPPAEGTASPAESAVVDGADPDTAAVEPLAPSGDGTPEPGDPANSEAKPVEPPKPQVPHVLYLRQTLRSGQSVAHKGHLIIIGDVNPGAEVSAEGDITIWGALRGIAHAGTAGNTNAEIRALRFDPIQLRIAHAIARSPDRPRGSLRSAGPETARIVNGTIRISSSAPE
jgi:septum site-determining protein MinC